ncbi:MAG: 4-(cytidine 5'-diphospho)-2-C-methyl-D-erythritol kinase [Oscillospiraceae bacterium]|jgi:4-diphosphocytidyl-2-C-methyl-D-erythritol kinase|nr:4-(cytidine 5'-diphospho)-2-C-methyl-D-erythritol kinase [Oscillospiraceae bacterium]
MKIKARAKINWALDVVGKRDDGYHLLDTLMQSVELYDTVEFFRSDTIELVAEVGARVPRDDSNLAIRTALLLRDMFKVEQGVTIKLTKRIPIGAGLGGGSADAAAVLVGLNRLWKLGLSDDELQAVGLRIGADVPFCICGGLARATGVGEVLERLPVPKLCYLVIVQPCRGLSTKEVFSLFDGEKARRADITAALDAVSSGEFFRMTSALTNALQPTAVILRPEIAYAIQALEHAGALTAQMSGSGSAVFGVFTSAHSAQKAWELMKPIWERSFTTRIASRGLVPREWQGQQGQSP